MGLSKYRPIRTEKGYASWLAEAAGAHGVYVIRERSRRGKRAVVLYVGESHTHRLRETLQRHFQQWSGRTAGPTFNAETTEVAMEIFLDGNDAIRRQNRLIRSLLPVHNVVVPDEENDPPEGGRQGKRKSREDAALAELMDYFGAFEGAAE
jgi:hypothetical protein